MSYDPDNIFAKILRGEIPCTKVYENDSVLAFRDIHPKAPVHILVIPKGAYTDMSDFAARASDAETGALLRAVGEIAKAEGLDAGGYRVVANRGGGDVLQEVPHLHLHILGGGKIGRLAGTE